MKKKKPVKQKIDVVLESLLNLERLMKELINKVENLEKSRSLTYNHPVKDNHNPQKYWPYFSDYNYIKH